MTSPWPLPQSASTHTFFATCAAGVADLLAAELKALGAERLREQRAGVGFEGVLELGYRACLWSRTASRILLQVAEVDAKDATELYRNIRDIDWSRHLDTKRSFAVDFSGSNSHITHTQFGALKVKDAIVDQFRDRFGERPSVRLDQPDVRITVHLNRARANVSIDLSGDPLHRRGYRLRHVTAPLKESLAAAVLLRSGWPAIAADGGSLVDPMCGSGTFLIEAAMILGNIAPGLQRTYYGFLGWKAHEPEVWQKLVHEANQQQQQQLHQQRGVLNAGRILGFDQDPAAVSAALANVSEAGFGAVIEVTCCGVEEFKSAPPGSGLLVVNPPYGERLGDAQSLEPLYAELGKVLRTHFLGWRAVVLTGNPPLARAVGIHAKRSHTLFNGAIECRLLRFEVKAEEFAPADKRASREEKMAAVRESPGAQMFANRLRKNFKKMRDWARKEGISCYRVYDADMPEYAFAVELYQGERTTLYVQEYRAPDMVDRQAATQRRLEVLAVVPSVFDVTHSQVVMREEQRRRDESRYISPVEAPQPVVIQEGGWQFLVELGSELDPGLHLVHRGVREMLGRMVVGRSFLNLFSGTGAATVYAAGGGAEVTISVEVSNTALGRAERNLALNRLANHRHTFVKVDPLVWLREQSQQARPQRFDLIYLDAPAFQRGKWKGETFDVQRDHVRLLVEASALLASGGTMMFTTRLPKFRLDRASLFEFEVEDVSKQTLPRDFERSARDHSAYVLKRN